MRKHLVSIISVVIYCIVSLFIIYLHIHDYTPKVMHVMDISASPWLSEDHNNMIMLKIGYVPDIFHSKFDKHTVIAHYQDSFHAAFQEDVAASHPRANGESILQLSASATEAVNWRFDWVDSGFDHTSLVSHSNNPRINNYYNPLYNGGTKVVLNDNDKAFIKKHTITSASINNRQKFGRHFSYYPIADFRKGIYKKPRTEIAIYPRSAFVPHQPTEVLYVDIRDGNPWEGDIIVTQLNAPNGAEPQIVKANASGVTSLSFTLTERASFSITAGDHAMEATFEPRTMPFTLKFEDASESSCTNLYRTTPAGDYTDSIRSGVHITPIKKGSDIIIDYFEGYAWINRQIVPADELNQTVCLTPGFKFGITPQIIYARFSMAGFEDEAQTVPLIASNDIRRKSDTMTYYERGRTSEHTIDTFGAFYQDYIKLTELNAISLSQIPGYYYSGGTLFDKMEKIYQSADAQDHYDIFSVAKGLKHFINDENAPNYDKYSDERQQIQKYLLTRLAALHHPQIIRHVDDLERATAKLNYEMRSRKRSAWFYSMLWLSVGIVGCGAAARRIRIRRQQQWFDAAAKGMEKGDLPSAPIWLKILIAALFFGIIESLYMYISLL